MIIRKKSEVPDMPESNHISIRSDNRDVVLNISTVLYVLMKKNYAEIHTFSGKRYKTRMTLNELEKELGDSFLRVSRGCLVAVMAIHDITNVIELTNGESLSYPVRNRNEITARFQAKQKRGSLWCPCLDGQQVRSRRWCSGYRNLFRFC